MLYNETLLILHQEENIDLLFKLTFVFISVNGLHKMHFALNINCVLDVGKCREISAMKTIFSLSCELTIPVG